MDFYSYIVFNFVYLSNVRLFDSHLNYSQQSPLKGRDGGAGTGLLSDTHLCKKIHLHPHTQT